MSKVILGEQARRHYQSVKYFQFGNKAGSSFVLTSHPFNYLQSWLDNKLNEIQRDSGKKRDNLKKAKYFTDLSEEFYLNTQQSKMPTKGTLLYYSLLNLVKVYLIIKGFDLEAKTEHHGLTLPANLETKLKLTPNNDDDSISIFHEFGNCLGKPILNSEGVEIRLEHLLRDLPEVHEIGYALNLFPHSKRKFLPIDLVIRTNKPRNKLYYTLSFEKKNEKLMRTDKLCRGIFKEKLQQVEIEDERLNCYKSVLKINYTRNSEKSWEMAYKKLVKDISDLNITTLLTRNGYRNYLNLEPARFHRLSSTLAFAYYIGTVARYRPTLNEKILKGKYQALISEAIISCPNQFYYQLVSYITEQVCAVPQAKIN
ncbi:YaaC family protein [archaeon]|nr:YaaC family protein [archaeon]